VALITKSALIERDLDLLASLAADGLVQVTVSVTTLDDELKRRLEPRTASPARRLTVVRRLAEAGIPVAILFAPVIPALNDHELENVLEASANAGATRAGYVVLRLPHEVAPLFGQWLQDHYPLRAAHVLSLVRQFRDGELNDPCFGTRMRGTGTLAKLLEQRFRKAAARFGLEGERGAQLNTAAFRVPPAPGEQLGLW
jgi:DNA repair photolyase